MYPTAIVIFVTLQEKNMKTFWKDALCWEKELLWAKTSRTNQIATNMNQIIFVTTCMLDLIISPSYTIFL